MDLAQVEQQDRPPCSFTIITIIIMEDVRSGKMGVIYVSQKNKLKYILYQQAQTKALLEQWFPIR